MAGAAGAVALYRDGRNSRGGLVRRRTLRILSALALAFTFSCLAAGPSQGQGGENAPASGLGGNSKAGTWKFAVSGDSRNCGDVVMPAIAAGVAQSGALFYWHLGDFRWISSVDEDIEHQPEHLGKLLAISEYRDLAWQDFISSQIAPFRSTRVYLGIGNHETVLPKTHDQYLAQFADWLDAPDLRAQRLRDDPSDRKPKTYYHWNKGGVDFINLDNASDNQFDPEQIAWFERMLRADSGSSRIRTLVVGMHEALPESISKGHSMNQSEAGTQGGRRVYADLIKAQTEAHKRVYVLASHSHYFMDGIFNTDYWRAHGGVLSGWIIGTAGAVRYALPQEAGAAHAAETNVYGFLVGTVGPDGRIEFAFQRLKETDIPSAVVGRYTPEFVHWCFAENSEAR
jgi:hypothetical protein